MFSVRYDPPEAANTVAEWQMRSTVVVIVLVAALVTAFIADIYWCGGSYSRMVVHSLRVGFYFLVDNW